MALSAVSRHKTSKRTMGKGYISLRDIDSISFPVLSQVVERGEICIAVVFDSKGHGLI